MRNLGIFAATAWMALAATQVQAQQIGVAASIERAMRATAPGQSERRLTDGADVVADDRINTGSDERGQLLFLDETTLSVAPSSQIVLDRFIYDPSGGSSGFAHCASSAVRQAKRRKRLSRPRPRHWASAVLQPW